MIPYSADLNPSKFSVEAWVKTSVVDKEIVPLSSSFGDKGWWWQTTAGNWAGGGFGGYAPIIDYNPAAAIAPGQWTHLVVLYDGTRLISGTHYPYVYYVNGQTDGYVWTGDDANTAGPFIIGGGGVDANTLADRFFDGQVDEVAVYQAEPVGDRIGDHFNARFGSVTKPYSSEGSCRKPSPQGGISVIRPSCRARSPLRSNGTRTNLRSTAPRLRV